MNYKSLLFTALAGVMITSACVKNLESPSVTKVREAKAAEMEAAAALNKANAEATVTLANANAALTLAKAEVEKANAAKIAAETELVRINAELARVDVELAKVRVEEEKVRLEILKEQLEQEKVRTETAKAQAELQLQIYAAKMQNLIAQMEIDAVRQKVEMQKALTELEKALAEYNENEREIILDLYDQIAAKQTEWIDLNLQLLVKQAQAAQLEATLENPEEVYADIIKAYQSEIKRAEMVLAYLHELEGMSSDELKTLATALSIEASRIYEEVSRMGGEYNKAWDKYFDALQTYKALTYNSKMKKAVSDLPFTFENVNGEIVSSITKEVLFTPESGSYKKELTPAKANVEALTDHIEARGNQIDEKYILAVTDKCIDRLYFYEPYNDVFYTHIENPMTYAEALEHNDAQIAYVDELLASVEGKVEAAHAAMVEAEQARKDAYDEYVKAYIESSQDVEIPLPVAAYNAALAEAENFYFTVYKPTQEEGNDLPYSVEAAEDNVYYAEKDQIAAAKAFEAAYKEFEAKQKVTDTKKAALDKLQADYDKLVADARTAEKAMHQAELAYLADPKAETEKAWKEAEETYKKADKAAEDFKSEKLSLAIVAYWSAYFESDGAQKTMLTAMDTKKSAEDAVDEAKAQLEAKKEYDVRMAAVQLDMDGLNENVEAADAELQKWYDEGAHTEKGDACREAIKKYKDARIAADKASEKYETVLKETNYDSLLAGKSVLESISEGYKNTLASFEEARVASHEELAESVKTAEDTLAGEEEYTMVCEAVVNAYNAQKETYELYSETYNAFKDAYAQYEACESMIEDAEYLETEIAECEAYIAECKAMIDYYMSGADSAVKLIYLEEEIVNLQKKIEILDAILDSLVAELNSHLENL